MTLVVDASVIVKWLLRDPARESDTARATELMQAVATGQVAVLQPVHWLVELGAVLARLSPSTTEDDIEMLAALELPSTNEPDVLRLGCRLAADLGQHMFDTLYHAVALGSPHGVLVTADAAYLRSAARLGHIVALRAWQR